MKSSTSLLVLFFFITIAFSCGQRSGDHEHATASGDSLASEGNDALYAEVMKIHDEAMAKMNDIYTTQRELQDSLKNINTTEPAKQSIHAAIARLDSADRGMRDWMHAFEPVPDSVDEQKAREYLENEMEKIKKVNASIQEALDAAHAPTKN